MFSLLLLVLAFHACNAWASPTWYRAEPVEHDHHHGTYEEKVIDVLSRPLKSTGTCEPDTLVFFGTENIKCISSYNAAFWCAQQWLWPVRREIQCTQHNATFQWVCEAPESKWIQVIGLDCGEMNHLPALCPDTESCHALFDLTITIQQMGWVLFTAVGLGALTSCSAIARVLAASENIKRD
jgi:hypothetical protein